MNDFEFAQSLIEEKNSISSQLPWLIAIELHTTIDLEGYNKIVSDSQDFIWKDKDDNEITFLMFPFNVGNISFNASGKFPSITLSLFNTAFIVKKIEENAGFLGIPLTLYFVNVKAVSEYNTETYPLKFNFLITDCKISKYIELTLGAPNYLTRNLPARHYYRDFCPYEYRQEFCWMKNFEPIQEEDWKCNKSWNQCVDFKKRYNPDMRGVPYGGFPNLARGNVYYY
jgi:hypothetical protein